MLIRKVIRKPRWVSQNCIGWAVKGNLKKMRSLMLRNTQIRDLQVKDLHDGFSLVLPPDRGKNMGSRPTCGTGC